MTEFLSEALGENLFPGLFQLLELACILGSQPYFCISTASKVGQIVISQSHLLLPHSSTYNRTIMIKLGPPR